MVRLSSLLKVALPIAIVGAFIIFRKQIVGAVSGAAEQVGGGIGEAVGAGFRGIVTELPTGIATGLAGGVPPSAQDFWGWFTGGGYLGEQLRKQEQVPATNIIIGGSQPTQTDQVITPTVRDYSDKPRQTYGQLTDIVKAATAALKTTSSAGHAERARAVISVTGFSPLASFKESLPQLRSQGYSAAEAYRIWSDMPRP